MAIDKRKSRVFTGGGQISLDAAAAPGLAQMRAGRELEAIGDSMISESKKLMKAQVEADRASVLANTSSQAQFELQQSLSERRQQISDENGNPLHNELDNDTQKIGQGIINKYAAQIKDPVAKRKFVERMNRSLLSERLRSQSVARGQQQSFAINSLVNNRKALTQRASVGDPTTIKEAQAELQVQTDALIANGTITPQQAQAQHDRFRKDVMFSRMKDAVTTNPTGTLQRIEDGTHPLLSLLDKDEKRTFTNAAKAAALAEDKQRAAVAKNATNEVKKLDTTIENGTKLNKEDFDAARDKVESIRQHAPKRAAALDENIKRLEKKHEIVQKYNKLDEKERERTLEALEKSGASRTTVKRLRGIHNRLKKEAQKDPLAYASRIGIIDEVTPIDASANIGEQIDKRLKQVDVVEGHLGRTISPLTKQETDAFIERYNSSSFTDRAQILGSMVGSLGNKSKQFLKSIAKKGQTKLAYVGNLVVNGRKDLAISILKGDHNRKQNLIQIPDKGDSGKAVTNMINEKMPTTTPERRRVLNEAVKSVYASLSIDENDYSGELNTERLQKAAEMVLGKEIEYNGEKISPPSPDVGQKEFEEQMKSLTDEDVQTQGGNISADILRNSKLVSLGDGRYIVMVPTIDPKSGETVYKGAINSKGAAFIFDSNAVQANRDQKAAEEGERLSHELDAAKEKATQAISNLMMTEVVMEMDDLDGKGIDTLIQKESDPKGTKAFETMPGGPGDKKTAEDILKKEFAEVRGASPMAKSAVKDLAGPEVMTQESSKGESRITKAASAAATSDSYMTIASRYLGAHERKHNSTLRGFFKKSTGSNVDPARVAWCAKFANSVIEAAGGKGTGSLAARSFLKWGTPTNSPQQGDIVVLWRKGRNSQFGHVGFFAGFNKNGDIQILGGNQGDSVSIRTYSKDRLLGYRRPPGPTTIKNEVFGDK